MIESGMMVSAHLSLRHLPGQQNLGAFAPVEGPRLALGAGGPGPRTAAPFSRQASGSQAGSLSSLSSLLPSLVPSKASSQIATVLRRLTLVLISGIGHWPD